MQQPARLQMVVLKIRKLSWLPKTDTDPKLEMENFSRATFSVVLTNPNNLGYASSLEIRLPKEHEFLSL